MKSLLMALLLSSCAFGSDFTRGNQVDAVDSGFHVGL